MVIKNLLQYLRVYNLLYEKRNESLNTYILKLIYLISFDDCGSLAGWREIKLYSLLKTPHGDAIKRECDIKYF